MKTVVHQGVLSTIPSQCARDVDDVTAECVNIPLIGRGSTAEEAIADLEESIKRARSLFGAPDQTIVVKWPDGTSSVFVATALE